MTQFRTDIHRNPTAFTTDIAREGGLILGTDYEVGAPFDSGGRTFFTAKLLGDPILTTVRVIDKIGFYTNPPNQRWTYIGIPFKLWLELTPLQKLEVIGFMYSMEGGTEMKSLFQPPPTSINVQILDAMKLGDG